MEFTGPPKQELATSGDIDRLVRQVEALSALFGDHTYVADELQSLIPKELPDGEVLVGFQDGETVVANKSGDNIALGNTVISNAPMFYTHEQSKSTFSLDGLCIDLDKRTEAWYEDGSSTPSTVRDTHIIRVVTELVDEGRRYWHVDQLYIEPLTQEGTYHTSFYRKNEQLHRLERLVPMWYQQGLQHGFSPEEQGRLHHDSLLKKRQVERISQLLGLIDGTHRLPDHEKPEVLSGIAWMVSA